MADKRSAWILVAIAAIAAAAWYRSRVMQPPAPRPMGTVVLVTGGSGPYWQSIASGARAAAKKHGVDLKVEMPADDENVAQQTDLLARLSMKGVDGVALCPLDAEAQASLINQMADAAVVVTVDSDAPQTIRDTYIGTSNLAAGRMAARLVREAIPEGGQVGVVLANLTKDNMIERRAGFEEAINQPPYGGAGDAAKFEIVGFEVDEGNEERSRENIAKLIADHPEIKSLVAMNGYQGPEMLRVLKEKDKLGDVKLVAFDDFEETLQGVESGEIFATIVQDPYRYGYEAVQNIATKCRGDEGLRPLGRSQSTFNISAQPIKKGDLADFKRQRDERLGEASDKTATKD